MVEYIERFIADLANRGAQIANLLDRLNVADVGRLLPAAAQREAGDALPDDAPGADPDGQQAQQARAAATSAALTAWENRWRGLTDWFLSDIASLFAIGW
ncbi:DUF2397 family protein [Kitasatospora sp. NPDC094028]